MVYYKSDKSESHRRLKRFTNRPGMRAQFKKWNDMCDLVIGLGSLAESSGRDTGKFTEEDFHFAARHAARNSQIETLTLYRRGKADRTFLNAYDDDLLTLGEDMSA